MGWFTRANQSTNPGHNITVTKGYPIDASITQSQRKPKTKPSYEVVNDREDRNEESEAKEAMRVIEVIQSGVDAEARWVRKGGQSIFGINNIQRSLTMRRN